MSRADLISSRLVCLAAGLTAFAIIGLPAPIQAADEPGPSQTGVTYLVDTTHHPLPDGVTQIRDVGFGWVHVQLEAHLQRESTANAPHTIVLDSLGLQPNTVYQLLDEPLFDQQWALENTGQTGGTVGADINVLPAWAVSQGGPSQVIAIIDSGIDLDHPDLVDNIWSNTAEIANGLDDDNNGYVDDLGGWDFVDDDGIPNDTYGHGSGVAAAAAASINDAGIAGVAPTASLMPIRVCLSNQCSLAAVIQGIAYAIDNGATIINLSLGSHAANPALEAAVSAANAAGVLVVASAGNDGTNNDIWPLYPANINLPNVISVAASDHNDLPAVFAGGGTNYGASTVDLAAPGASVLTAILGDWTERSGTSFSSPMVAGAAALIGSVRPSAGAAEIKSILMDNVDVLESFSGLVVSEGRLNVGQAVTRATAPIPAAIASPPTGTLPFTVGLDATGSTDPNGTIVLYEWHTPQGPVLSGSVVQWNPPTPGLHILQLRVTDNDGLASTLDVPVYANETPTALAAASPLIGWAPQIVVASAKGSTDNGGSLVQWAWQTSTSFASGQEASILFPLVGVHNLELTVVDNDGASDTDNVTIYIGTDFIDTRTSTFRSDIAWMSAVGVTRGCNPPGNDRFCPRDTLTRGELAAFLTRYLDLPHTTVDAFGDDDASTFEGDINRLAAAGVTLGCNPPLNDSYCPDEALTRAQLAAMLVRALDLPQTSTDHFDDDTGSIFESNINSLADAEITTGCNPPANNRFCPSARVTRGEFAAFLRRAAS